MKTFENKEAKIKIILKAPLNEKALRFDVQIGDIKLRYETAVRDEPWKVRDLILIVENIVNYIIDRTIAEVDPVINDHFDSITNPDYIKAIDKEL